MTRKQLQVLLSAGIFSSALISGTLFADDADNKTPPKAAASVDTPKADAQNTPPPPSDDTKAPKNAVSQKNAADHGCGGAGGCGSSAGSSNESSTR